MEVGLSFLRDRFLVWTSLIAGLSLSLAAATWVYQWERSGRAEKFARQVNALQASLQSHLDSSTQVSRSLAGLYSIQAQPSPDEFARFTGQVLQGASVLSGAGFAQHFSDPDATNLPAQAWQFGASGQRQPLEADETRARLLTTQFVPASEAEAELGFDHGSDWQRQAAIAKARDIGILAATDRVRLTDGQTTGFILYVPVYRSLEIASQATRQAEFTGVAYTVLPSRALIQQAVRETNSKALRIYLYQLPIDYLDSALSKNLSSLEEEILTSYQQETFSDQPPEPTENQSLCPFDRQNLACLRSLNWVDGEWSILVLPDTGFGDRPWRAASVLAVGCIGTVLLSLYLNSNFKHRRQQAFLLNALLISSTQLKRQKEQAEQALSKLMQAQSQLVHAEKMSGLGQLIAGITHEINNPIGFIYGNVSYASQYANDLLGLVSLYQEQFPEMTPEIAQYVEDVELDFIKEDFPQIINSMKMGAERIQELVISMRSFSRLDEAELKPTDLHAGLDSTLTILRHRLKAKGQQPEIVVTRNYGQIPLVECTAGQLNQVFMNLISNSIDALREGDWLDEQPPQIEIATEVLDPERICITISDNGSGIPDEVYSRIFDPFFTTKPVGKGTGLGLSISYQIVTEFHDGQLQCRSIRDQGTQFTIILPIEGNPAKLDRSLSTVAEKIRAVG